VLSFEDAQLRLIEAADRAAQCTLETIDTLDCAGRVLGSPIASALDVPPADNSAMDGYAIRIQDRHEGELLPVSQRVPAGTVPTRLLPGTAARVFTGAMIPLGADCVVMQEDCKLTPGGVEVLRPVAGGENIRRRGEDIAAGTIVLPAGKRLRAADAGLLASIGVAQVEVYRPLRVAILFTGDELVMPGEVLPEGAIYNSNRYVLTALLRELGCQIRDLGIVADSFEATRHALRDAAQGADLVLTCGGVSVGEEDHVKAAVMAEGTLDTWRIAIKPGKPLAMGRIGATPFIGLPGNPVSSFVTFQMLVRAYVRRAQGEIDCVPRPITMQADFSAAGRPVREFLRVKRNGANGLDLFPSQGSGVLSSCVWADGLVSNPPRQDIRPGDQVSYFSFGEI
jgi:molybdopterin molybdotransferase